MPGQPERDLVSFIRVASNEQSPFPACLRRVSIEVNERGQELAVQAKHGLHALGDKPGIGEVQHPGTGRE
jgi:hypothetical protein